MNIHFTVADYHHPVHQRAILTLMEGYTRDPMGGGKPLSRYSKNHLITGLQKYPTAVTVLAFSGEEPVGLVTCFESLSTFAAKPLLNIHDVTVQPQFRGQGVATTLLSEVEKIARARGCCKLTLEVLSGNEMARKVYRKNGFGNYQLDPAMGHAEFWEKDLLSG